MDETVIKYYRRLTSGGFEHAGQMEKPTITLDAVGENMRICDHVGTDTLKIFIKVKGGVVTDVKYLCMCDPTTNVAVEIFCGLATGCRVEALSELAVDSFLGELGGESQDLAKKAKGLMELVELGVRRYLNTVGPVDNWAREGEGR